jgi:hypothetical protein
MAKFDRNQWYHIYFDGKTTQALMGSQLYNQTTQSGTVFFQTFKKKEPAHQWQFYPVEDSKYYLLRTKASGKDGFLGTKFSPNEETPGHTVPRMIRGNVSDDSIYWNVGTFPDGTFFLSNKLNKTTYHLTRKGNSLAAMTSNTSASLDLPGQHFSFDAISAIDNQRFSTVSVSLLIRTPKRFATYLKRPSSPPQPRPLPLPPPPPPPHHPPPASPPAPKPVSASASRSSR